MPDLETWKKRYTVREFDKSRIPSDDTINYITDCLNYLPIQQTDRNTNLPNHLVFLLTPEDEELKEFLVKNVFHDPEKVEHFTTLYEAPYLFLLTDALVYSKKLNRYDSVEDDWKFRVHIGLTTGIIISQALEIGLDVCQIACTTSSDQINQEITEILNNKFLKELTILSQTHNVDIKIGELVLGIGVGFGKPLSVDNKRKIHNELDVLYYSGKKLTKKQPFMFVK